MTGRWVLPYLGVISVQPSTLCFRSFGRTPLHMCTGEQKAHIMCKLGADVNAMDAAGQTPVDLAAAAERPLVRCTTSLYTILLYDCNLMHAVAFSDVTLTPCR